MACQGVFPYASTVSAQAEGVFPASAALNPGSSRSARKDTAVSPAPDSPRYRNDTWSLEDGLGLGRAGDRVARMALEVDPPFTIGVTGKWEKSAIAEGRRGTLKEHSWAGRGSKGLTGELWRRRYPMNKHR
jgi:hypothetical protein